MHLSMPQTIFEFNGVNILWKLHEVGHYDHLQLKNDLGSVWIGNLFPLSYNKVFSVDIRSLRDDIIDSVFGKNKYMEDIKNNSTLNGNFRRAIKSIYDTKN